MPSHTLAPRTPLRRVGAAVARLLGTPGVRSVLVAVLTIGSLAGLVGSGTFAAITVETPQAFAFTLGTIELDQSQLTTESFAWTTARGGTNCSTKLRASTIFANQRMVPGSFCVAPLTIVNTGSVDTWLLIRIARVPLTPGETAGADDDALNRLLIFYMHEYSAGANGVPTAQSARDAECGGGNPAYAPSSSTNAATIANRSPANGVGGRTALLSLGTTGRSLGAETPNVAGRSAMTLTTLAAGPSPANRADMPAGSSFNLVGNDSVVADLVVSPPDGAAANEAILLAGASSARYYCAAMFFPSDGNLAQTNTSIENQAQGGDPAYAIYIEAAQSDNR